MNGYVIGIVIQLIIVLSGVSADHEGPECKPFEMIYENGKTLCENLWGNSFVYEENESHAYTMWFFDHENNPNDETSVRLQEGGLFQVHGGLPVQECHLEFYHKPEGHPLDNEEHVSEEPSDFQECHPWALRSCCFQETVNSPGILRDGYGPEFRWDRCGRLSQACERFFVQEACFYECEPNAGIFRRFKDDPIDPDPFNGTEPLYDPACDIFSPEYNEGQGCDSNQWEIFKMPISASYCDAWWLACKDDLFCAEDGGNFFSCAATYHAKEEGESQDSGGTSAWTYGIIIIAIVVAVAGIGGVIILVYREKKGRPIFEPLMQS